MDRQNEEHEGLISLTADIVSAHVGNNAVAIGDLPNLIAGTYGALAALASPPPPAAAELEPAVPIGRSVRPDHIVCLEDGKKLKMLKRHLMTHYQLTPDQYRQRWGLKPEYPMVAPAYAEQRRALAKKIGLGTRRSGSMPGARRAAG